MQKICSNGWCKTTFEVTNEDLAFYDKVSPVIAGKKYEIPAPMQCPDCRRQLRLLFRNEHNLYRRKSDATGESIISVYPPESRFTVYEADAWWSDDWDPFSYGMAFDFSKTFFEQFCALYQSIPHIALYNIRNENCDFVNQCGWSKNCYMAFMTDFSEDCLYTDSCIQSKRCVDSSGLHECEICYESVSSAKCYSTHFSRDCKLCSDCMFCSFCRGCSECFGCVNLRNKRHCIFNKQVSE